MEYDCIAILFIMHTLVTNLVIGGIAPMIVRTTPDQATAEFAWVTDNPCCWAETARKIETDVGGKMIKGVSVIKLDSIDPTAQVTAVAIIEAVSSYPALAIWKGTTGKTYKQEMNCMIPVYTSVYIITKNVKIISW